MANAETADELVHAIARDWRTARLAPADEALCAFATKLTREPHSMTPADLDALRARGFDDRGVHDAVQVIGYFNYVTRIADALGVEAETFIPPWGGEPHRH